MMVKPKHQRLVLVALAVTALVGAVLLAMWGLQDRAAYFVTPSDIAAGKVVPDKAMRLGGMVVKGSLRRDADGLTIRFIVSDTKAEMPVVYRGITPDLFKEGNGVIAEGRLDPNGLFVADNILAKHDERYMPPQMANEAAAPKMTGE
jgi:cytochrome c-type biogenesis protein CcmE